MREATLSSARPVKDGVTPKSLSGILVEAYPKQGFLAGVITRWRSRICPFHELVRYIEDGSTVLDVGCGAGFMLVILSYLGKLSSGIGVDTSSKAIETAQKARIPEGVEVEFINTSVDEPWPERSFDTVVCIDVLHHIPTERQRDFIKRLAAAVSREATIVFKEVSPTPTWKALASILHDLLLSRQWIRIRHEAEVEEWFREEGLTITDSRRLDMLCYSHYMIVARR